MTLSLVDVAVKLRQFDRGQPYWAMPVVAAHELQSPGSALLWATELLANGSAAAGRPLPDEWIGGLVRQQPQSIEEAHQLSQSIWYSERGRDEWQTAASRLYDAVGNRIAGSDIGYRRQIAMAIAVVAETVILMAPDRPSH